MGKDSRSVRLALLAAGLCLASSGSAQLPPQGDDWQAAQARLSAQGASDERARLAIAEWQRLSQSDGWGFGAYANFLIVNRGWPGEDRLRDLAEQSINPQSFDPGQVAAFFASYPPRTAVGKARHAFALAALGRMEQARDAARAAWIAGPLPLADEQKLLAQFAGSLRPADHDARVDALLWAQASGAAERVLPSMSPTRRPIAEARIAFQRRAPDAALKMGPADPIGVIDAGYLADKAAWLRDTGNSMAARDLLATRAPLMGPPANAEKWMESLLSHARAAAADGQWSVAYAIASKVDDAYAPGTDIRDRPLGERDDYTSLTWLAGSTALNKLGRFAEAEGMFDRYGRAARSPQTITKGFYWAGRAAEKLGRTAEAQGYLAQAGAFPDQFYGQLALERMGQSIPSPLAVQRRADLSDADRAAFLNRPVVRAARLLGQTGQWSDQTRFIRAIAASAQTDKDHLLAAELARALARPDLGVMVGRRATADGLSGYAEASFPRVSVPDGHGLNWTMIHAIARQESQFDRTAQSHAGARGLMQLMPGTARETAGRIGLSYMPEALTDTTYNIQLGSTYFQRMLDYYGGSYPLAVAAYNAGPGNVNKWIAANGDPRNPWVDTLQWIEAIPFGETRNYVQRVLENAVVYDRLNPRGAPDDKAPLSRYLGKRQPG